MRRGLATLLALGAVLPFAGCGRDEGKPIPRNQARLLVIGLTTAQRQADSGSCGTLLKTTIPALEARAQKISTRVGTDVRQTIRDGISHLRDLAQQDCSQPQTPTTTDTTQSTSTPSTSTQSTSTQTTTQTTTDKTTTSDTTPSDTSTSTSSTPSNTASTPTQSIPNGGTPGQPKPGKGNASGNGKGGKQK
jgi:hypothetical protein